MPVFVLYGQICEGADHAIVNAGHRPSISQPFDLAVHHKKAVVAWVEQRGTSGTGGTGVPLRSIVLGRYTKPV